MMRALGKDSVASAIKLGLEILRVLLWVAAFGLGLAAATYLALLGLIAVGALPEALIHGAEVRLERSGLAINGRIDGKLSAQIVAPGLLAAAVAIAGGLVIVDRLRKLFATFSAGDPFHPDNANRLRTIWMTLIAVEVSRYAIAVLTALLLAAFGQPEGSVLRPNLVRIDVTTWAAIGVIFVLAEVFKEGARLRADQDLTI